MENKLLPQKIKKIFGFVTIVIVMIIVAVVLYTFMKRSTYHTSVVSIPKKMVPKKDTEVDSGTTFSINIPSKIPNGFTRKSVQKTSLPDIGWIYILKYENMNKQQIVYKLEPQKTIVCEGKNWQKDTSEFKPLSSTAGCSISMINTDLQKHNIQKNLHWFIWNKGDITFNIIDQESILSHQEALDMANSVNKQIVNTNIITTKK